MIEAGGIPRNTAGKAGMLSEAQRDIWPYLCTLVKDDLHVYEQGDIGIVRNVRTIAMVAVGGGTILEPTL